MRKQVITKILGTSLLEHPSVIAWKELQLNCGEPERIEILKDRREWPVVRLVGAGPAHSAVIGKRLTNLRANVERTVYADILPQLPFRSLQYFGVVEEPNGEFCWLFIEDAGDEECLSEHRTLIARWLGLMHVSASKISIACYLPDCGPNHYLNCLRHACEMILPILRNPTNPALRSDDLAVLKRLVTRCEFLDSRWREVESFCEAIPRTLVHGDFVAKNMRVRNDGRDLLLLPFDWGTSGWAVPAADVSHISDIFTYWSVVRDHWPYLDIDTIQRLAKLGTIFRCLAAITWAVTGLGYEYVERPMRHLRSYEFKLADTTREIGLGV